MLPSSLCALALDLPGVMSDNALTAFVVILLAIGGFGLWLLVSRPGGPEGLLAEGVRLCRTAQYAEAEQCYRKALADESKLKPALKARLMVCLGDVLMDMDRYEDSRLYLEAALAMGDPRGSCRSSLADLFLLRGADPRKALDMANQAVEASTDGLGELMSTGRACKYFAGIVRAERWAQRAWALALLGRQAESQESIDGALGLAIPAHAALVRPGSYGVSVAAGASRCLAAVYWHTGEALLAMGQTDKAREHFLIASEGDPKSNYGARSRRHLERMGTSAG
jgi:tetratricopeptide (TPR) repeat protein